MTMIMMKMVMIMMIAGDNSARLLSGRGGGREIRGKPKNKTKKCWNVQGVINISWWNGGKLMNIGDKFWKFIIDSEMRKLGENKKRITFVMISSQGHCMVFIVKSFDGNEKLCKWPKGLGVGKYMRKCWEYETVKEQVYAREMLRTNCSA